MLCASISTPAQELLQTFVQALTFQDDGFEHGKDFHYLRFDINISL